MTTPEAGRVELIAAILRGLKAYAPDEVETYGRDEAEMIADYVAPLLTTQAETIRQLEGRIKELEQERDFCAETVQLFQGNEGRETIRRLEGERDFAIAGIDAVRVSLEKAIALFKQEKRRAEAAEETIRKQGQMIRDLTIAADAAEQRAEAAEGWLRQHGRHPMVCGVFGDYACSCGLAALLTPATGEGA